MKTLVAILFISSFFFFSYAQIIVHGDTVTLGGGIAYPWVEVDNDNVPIRIGITLSEGAVTNPAAGTKSIDFPKVTVDSLFKHAYFDYAPNGHPPSGVYGAPHFDFHFYMIPESERLLIPAGIDTIPISEEFMPEDYISVPGIGTYSFPAMGVHYADSLAEEFNGGSFRRTLIYGFYESEMIFIEPMITIQHLLIHPSEILPIKQPDAYQRTGYYPINYGINFDNTNNLYEIYLTDFVLRAATTSAYDNQETGLIQNFTLNQNYPNPFNPGTTISFSIPEASFVTLKIFNSLGEEIETLVTKELSVGNYTYNWKATGLTSGIYFYKLQTESFVETKKMILLK